MSLRIKNVSEVYNMQVFTDAGDYFGDVDEAILQGNKVAGWRIRATKNSFLTRILSGARGVIVPHQLVRAVGDIMVISKNAVPSYEDQLEEDDSLSGDF
ncbi:MAG: PRC-barrel domain-containing protein [Nanoarchaeota archaeon]|nr:PRC-barrel domain-containing protein [Nanoarchaeota archaeon]